MISHTSELGLRGKLPQLSGAGSEIDWNLSVFRTLLKDDIFGIATSVSQGFFQNIGDTRREGFEAGLNYRGPRLVGLCQLQLRAGDLPIADYGAFALEPVSKCERRHPGGARRPSARHSQAPREARRGL